MAKDMPKGQARAKAFLRSASDFFWPPRSLIRGARGMGSGPLSPEDFAQLRFISDPLCDRCGVPLDYRTGATLSACPRALKQAGARHVDVLVLARVVRETDVTI